MDSRKSAAQHAYHTLLHPSSSSQPGRPMMKIVGLSKFCYSACLSHFAAPFIIIPAKASNAENCGYDRCGNTRKSPAPDPEAEQKKRARNTTTRPSEAGKTLSTHSLTPEREVSRPCRPTPLPLTSTIHREVVGYCVQMILPQVHLRKPCYDFSFL